MTYKRVIPRDLFNEGSLLTCLGKVYTNLENYSVNAKLVEHSSLSNGFPFRIDQDESDGSIYVLNVYLLFNGRRYDFYRGLNSRAPWPLYIRMPEEWDMEDIAVFGIDGTFTPEMLTFLGVGK